ncbi:MAG: hypothetical protein JWQ04_880 [Pedosphaera sp.]|nr:hypothetical protein [Pedosphaera sp.]
MQTRPTTIRTVVSQKRMNTFLCSRRRKESLTFLLQKRASCRLPILILFIAGFGLSLIAGTFQLSSVVNPALGAPAGGSGDSFAPVLSADGRYALFASAANNLVLNSNNNPYLALSPPKLNVFLRDRTNGTTTLVNVNLAGTGGADGDSFPVAVSTNGQYVLFESSAGNLVTGVTNHANNVFLRDLVNGMTLLVSVSTNGTGGSDDSRSSVMTPDARYVAFVSAANNLVPGDTNGIPDIFVRDMQGGVTTLASPGATGSGVSSELPDLTPDGRYVAFYSTAINLVPGVATKSEIYIRDLLAGTTTLASAYAHTAVQLKYSTTNSLSISHAISDDGQFVAYEALSANNSSSSGIILRFNQATSLTDTINTNAPGVTSGSELFRHALDITPDGRFVSFVANVAPSTTTSTVSVWDALSNTTTLASGSLTNNTPPTNSTCDWPVMDSTGRYVAFLSSANGLTSNSVTSGIHLYVRDLQASLTQLVDADTNGIGSTPSSMTYPRMSTNGLFVAFEATDGSLVSGDNNQSSDVFLRDVANQTTELISARHPDLPPLTPNGLSTLSTLSVSTNGRYVAFSSDANNLVATDTNNLRDVFVHDLWNNTNILVSVDTNGLLSGNSLSTDSAISGDGRYVAFTSLSSNLVTGDTNGLQDVFVRDLQLGKTTLVSINGTHNGPGNGDSYSPIISANGRYVLFHSKAQNLAAGIASTTYENLFWRDLQTGITRVFTTGTAVTLVAGAMTPDGRYVAVATPSASLYVWDTQLNTKIYTNVTASAAPVAISPDGTRLGFLVTGASGHVYAADRIAKTTVTLGTAPPASHPGLRFSGDNRYLAYVAADVNKTNQVYVYDFQMGTSLLISQSTNVIGSGNGHSDSPDISSDGRYVTYRSIATNLGPGAANGMPNLYLYDLQAGTTLLLGGISPGSGRSLTPVFSGDAQTLVFESWDGSLAAQDFNQWSDIFTLGLSATNAQATFNAAIISPGPSGQFPAITWTTTPGKTYQVQFKNNLSDPVWQVLNGTITISGNQETLSDPAPSSPMRFYRIVSF